MTNSSERASALLSPVELGRLQLSNRIVMAPLTRSRASATGVPHESARLYYAQRASAGLIVSEGACISPTGVGHPDVPGLWMDEQLAGWRSVTDAVHARGGKIVAQLWHTGRASHPTVQPNGEAPVGPSAVAAKGTTFTRDGIVPFVTPRELTSSEVRETVGDYARAAENALRAGFDGVEIHGANGYLIDQFLHESANRRTDEYGGSIENRCRFLFEVVEEVVAAIGADRVGLRLAPSSSFGDMHDSDPAAVFDRAVVGVAEVGLAYLHIVEPGISGADTIAAGPISIDSAWCRERWPGGLIAAGDYTRDTGEEAIQSGRVDAVAYGRAILANPDLKERFAQGAALNAPERATFYGGDDHGYLDYPSLEAEHIRGELRRRILAGEAHVLPDIEPVGPHSTIDSWPLAWAVQRLRTDEGVVSESAVTDAPTLKAAIDARTVIELGVAWVVSGRIGQEPASVLREQADRVRSLIKDGEFVDREQYLVSNEALHNQLVAVAGNRALLDAFQSLELRTQIADALKDSSTAHPEVEEAYGRLVDAVTGSDFQQAREAILAFGRIARERVGGHDAATSPAATPASAGALAGVGESSSATPSAAELIETDPTDARDAVAALLEAIEARSIIEIGVTQFLRDRPIPDSQRKALLERVERLSSLLQGDRFVDVARYVAENSAFHDAYVGLLENPALLGVFRVLDVPNLMMQTTTRTSPTRSEIIDDYRRLVQALPDGDADEASEAIAAYMDRVHDIVTSRPDYPLG